MMKDSARLFQIDAFTGQRFKGNPAGVCILKNEIPVELMQSIAMEMNLSETAFVKTVSPGVYDLRWFTPTLEVPLCGHATLATAHVLFNELGVDAKELTFDTLSGRLNVVKEGDEIRLDFPIGKPEKIEAPKLIIEALAIGENDYEEVQYCRVRKKFLVRLKDETMLRSIKPNFQKMQSHKPNDTIGVIITSAGSVYDFVSRFFAPWVGVNEDPVTGSAHTVLAPYWSNILEKKTMRAYQASKRGGELTVRIEGARVHLIGKAVTVFQTEIEI